MLAVSWRDIILAVLPEATLSGGASGQAIAAAEGRLGLPLPHDLVELLRETDGIRAADGTPVVWAADQLVRDGDLLVVGGCGGERFAYELADPAAGILLKDRVVGTDLADYVVRALGPDTERSW
ncbi:hypothetical protein [Actinoplanes sp. NPDC051859]|uniref:hypothetical protein n=1 Tax=Actinoplanes sp. NPDC051859 TaxID=3363909 RepID=UPI0037A4E030